jgi:lipid A 3-O-deacylase
LRYLNRANWIWLLVLFSCPIVPLGAETVTPAPSWTFYWENDAPLESDLYYTNGIRFSKAFGGDGMPHWAEKIRVLDWLDKRINLCATFEDNCFQPSFSWSVGQNLYTPDDIRSSELLVTQRPYGAWLYYGNILSLRKHDLFHSLELDIGAVGPVAIGEYVQSGFHGILRALNGTETPVDPKGWEHQLGNQPGIQALYEGRRRIVQIKPDKVRYADFVPQVGGALGTVFVHAEAGAMLRVGYNVPDELGPIRIIAVPEMLQKDFRNISSVAADSGVQVASADPLQGFEDLRDRGPDWELFGFVRVKTRYVGFNTFLDGNLEPFGPSHSVETEDLVDDLEIGGTLRFRKWRLTLSRVDREREFVGQSEGQKYGTLTLSYQP